MSKLLAGNRGKRAVMLVEIFWTGQGTDNKISEVIHLLRGLSG